MVYKIRNKGFYTPFNNNYRVCNPKKTKIRHDFGELVTFQVHITRYTGLRILHNYRNISRATKQFMMGDNMFERLMVMILKDLYFIPTNYKAPIEQVWCMVSPNLLTPLGT